LMHSAKRKNFFTLSTVREAVFLLHFYFGGYTKWHKKFNS